jgi:hypothetical protein
MKFHLLVRDLPPILQRLSAANVTYSARSKPRLAGASSSEIPTIS